MLPRLPYLQNAVAGYDWNDAQSEYVDWMRSQGVIMPIEMPGDIDSVRIEFVNEEAEIIFKLRWS